VEIEKRGPTKEAIDELKVETKQDGDRIEVEVKKPAHEVVVLRRRPHVADREADRDDAARRQRHGESGDGSIRIEHVHGRLELEDRRRQHPRDRHRRPADARDGDGSVTLEDVGGDLDVDTGDGSVSVAGKLAT
jgi:hypothetical protein